MKKILLTGSTGYIGKRLLYVLLNEGYFVYCCTRDKSRFESPKKEFANQYEIIEVDFLKEETLRHIPDDIDGAYYLMHSMSGSENYEALEQKSAKNFTEKLNETACQHVIYLTGIANANNLSKHLQSRLKVEEILSSGKFHFTALRAGIIIGSGSASFEIIRDLVEKLPIMITPKWLKTKCQPIGIANVLDFLLKTLFNKAAYDNNYDIGCQDILTYKEMLQQYAEVRELNRHIFIVPVMTPKLSSYWLYFITSTTYNLAKSLVESMKIEVICRPNSLAKIKEHTGVKTFGYKEALARTLSKIEAEEIVSSWKDSFVSSRSDHTIKQFMEIPKHGCFIDLRKRKYDNRADCIERIWRIGGKNGWYSSNFLWKIRGFLDQVVGGVGLRRGRRHPSLLNVGDALDFWRVLYADRNEGKLILFAEMRLPGEAWLQFTIAKGKVWQKAVFRPKGILGRLYWYSVLPFHGLIFSRMLSKIANGK